MPLIQWSPELEVNVEAIDREHRRLVEMLNEMYEAIVAVKGQELMGEITHRMLNYAYEHFSHEEKMMTGVAYPGMLRHKGEHQAFMEKARSVADSMAKGDFVSSVDILKFLKNWLVDHILKIDKDFAAVLGGPK